MAAARENISAKVLAVVRSAGGQSLAPAEVRDFLAARGVDADLASVRRALARWATRGEIGKHDGRYFDLRPQSRAFEYAEILSQLEAGGTGSG